MITFVEFLNEAKAVNKLDISKSFCKSDKGEDAIDTGVFKFLYPCRVAHINKDGLGIYTELVIDCEDEKNASILKKAGFVKAPATSRYAGSYVCDDVEKIAQFLFDVKEAFPSIMKEVKFK